jgi:aldose 1-epimerase
MSATPRQAHDAGGIRVSNGSLSMVLSPFGARLVELQVPDREGRPDNVVLGFDDVAAYRANRDTYFGATVGRVANRISGAAFSLDGQRYDLAANNGRNHLHGGPDRALDRVEWDVEERESEHGPGAAFTYESPHLEEGYPGNLRVRAEYALSDAGELRLELTARTDAPTPVSLTNHTYWNLAGAGSRTVLDHGLRLAAEHVLVVDAELLPTGERQAVAGTALDFRQLRTIGEGLPLPGHGPGAGLDTPYVLDPARPPGAAAATLSHPGTGRVMDVVTSEPSFQVYSAGLLETVTGRGGKTYVVGSGLCLEPQRLPDAVNRPEFPSVVLRPEDEYRQVTVYRFSAH